MKKFLCLENNQSWYRDFKIGKIYTGDEGVIEDDHRCDWGTEELLEDGVIQPIETFERDGVEWILNQGEPIVPEGWLIDVMTGNGCIYESEECSHEWDWKTQHLDGINDYCIYAIRIISTGEPEQVVRGDVLHFTQQGFKRHQDHVLGGLEDMLQKEKDSRPLSPQETAYAAKMAEKDEDESGAGGGKTFPSSALRDMSDKTFANLLGMGQFIGGEE